MSGLIPHTLTSGRGLPSKSVTELVREQGAYIDLDRLVLRPTTRVAEAYLPERAQNGKPAADSRCLIGLDATRAENHWHDRLARG